MRNIVSAYVDRFLHDRRERLRFGGILLLLALLVAGIVFWRLSAVGVAMTNEVYCGMEEHQHDSSCYEEVLSCGLDETDGSAGHTHDSSCYETVTELVCGLEESEGHVHDDAACFDEDGNLVCSIPESEGHFHSESCYETTQVLICGLAGEPADAGHVHDNSCYEEVLVCETPEHVHSISCMVDETADLETAKDWEATLPNEEALTGVWAEDVVTIARSQLGYTESEANFQLAEDGESRQGYTRYGAWYGNEYGDWDGMFAAFCLDYAGVEDIPVNAGAYAWTVALSQEDLYTEDKKYVPVPGDLVFLNTDEDNKADTVAIVAEVLSDRNGEISSLTVIQGDYEDTVAEFTIDLDDDSVVGFGLLPVQPEEEITADTAAPAEEAPDDYEAEEDVEDGIDESDEEDAEESEASEEPADDSASDEASGEIEEASDEPSGEIELLTLTYEGEDYTVTVTYGPEAELPEDVELVVSEYEQDSETYQDRMAEAAELCEAEEEALEGVRLFNIGLVTEDEEGELVQVEPAAEVTVTIAFAGQDEAQEFTVIHFSDETEVMDAQSVFEDDVQIVVFDTDGFSDFMVLTEGDITTLAAESGKLEIFKYDSSEGSGYMEGYYVWVPAGTYLICYDMINGGNGGTETGQFMYVADGYFELIYGMENWYEATYKSGEWDTDEKDSTVGGTSSAKRITVSDDGSGGSYVYFKFDDNTFHELYAVYLVSEDEAPDSLKVIDSSGKTTTEKKDLRKEDCVLYEFEEYTITSVEAGGLSGAVFTLYGNSSGNSNAYTGYAYFTDNGDGSYTLAGWCSEYNEDGSPVGVSGNYTCYIVSGEDGSININGLPDYWIDFTLHEVSAPDGYEPIEDIHFEYEYNGSIGGGNGDNWTDDDLDISGGTLSIENDPTDEIAHTVGIYKYGDNIGNSLSGAQFTLKRTIEKDGASVTEYAVFSNTDGYYTISYWTENPSMAGHLTSGEDGMITIQSLSNGTYTLTETVAPDGYTLLEESIEFTLSSVDGGGEDTYEANIDISSGNKFAYANGYVINVNNSAGDNLEIFKYAMSDNGEVSLAGAEFTLSRTVEVIDEGAGEATGETTTEYAVLTDGVLTWTENASEASKLVSGDDGMILIPYPGAGSYTLTETKAPDGYLLLDENVTFSIDEYGTVTDADGDPVNGAVAVENVAGTTLPNTGGIGTFLFTALGLALIVGAGVTLVLKMKKREEE